MEFNFGCLIMLLTVEVGHDQLQEKCCIIMCKIESVNETCGSLPYHPIPLDFQINFDILSQEGVCVRCWALGSNAA